MAHLLPAPFWPASTSRELTVPPLSVLPLPGLGIWGRESVALGSYEYWTWLTRSVYKSPVCQL